MEITAQAVAQLRNMTGAGMMDCKKALGEAGGDFEAAVEILRKKGQSVSAKRADRDAREGAIFALSGEGNGEAMMIELNCETDFVAKNDDFQKLGQWILTRAAEEKPADLEALRAMKLDERTVTDHLSDAMGKIGEKIDVSKYVYLKAEKVVTYIHPGARIGVAVAFDKVGDKSVDAVGRDVAMQIAAMMPVAVDKDEVPQEVIQKEIEIGMEQARLEGKPEAMLEKIAQGKLAKFFRDSTLLNQEFVKDPSKTVAAHLKDSLGPDARVVAFKRLQLGSN